MEMTQEVYTNQQVIEGVRAHCTKCNSADGTNGFDACDDHCSLIENVLEQLMYLADGEERDALMRQLTLR